MLVVLLGVALLALTAWPTYRDRQQRREALDLYQASQFREAEPLLRKVVERRPEDVEAIKALAEVIHAGDEPAAAEPFLRRWAELRPKAIEPHQQLLELYRKQKSYEAARTEARAVLDQEPDNTAVRRRLAELCISSGHFDEAEQELRLCLKERPSERRLLLLLAEVERGRGRNEEAESVMKQLLAEAPNDPAVLLAAGTLYRETGRAEKAIPLLEQVLRQDPRRARTACYQLTMALEQAGRPEEARRAADKLRVLQDMQILRELLPSQPNNLEVKLRLAELLLTIGEEAEGRRLLEEVLARQPNYPPAQRLRERSLPK